MVALKLFKIVSLLIQLSLRIVKIFGNYIIRVVRIELEMVIVESAITCKCFTRIIRMFTIN